MITISKVLIIVLVAVSLGSQNVAAGEHKVVCYYGTWATYRHGNGQCNVEHLDPSLCTHMIYTFVGLNPNGEIRVLDSWLDLPDNWGRNNFALFNKLRNQNPKLKTLIAIGGWNEGSETYSKVMNDRALRQHFVQNALEFVLKYDFNGLDLDWEYPGQRGGIAADKDAFSAVVKELRQAFSPHGLLITAAVGAAKLSASISYDIKEISTYLDFINLMTYDLHGPWESYTGLNSPLYPATHDRDPQLNVEACVDYWISQGAAPEKLILGIPLYGHTFQLSNLNEIAPGSASNGAGQGGKYTNQNGMLGYNEFCEMQLERHWTLYWDEQQLSPYGVKGNQWIGFDDTRSIQYKAEYILKRGLGGGMVWSVETDDFRGVCGEKFPLLKTINRVLNGEVPTLPPPTTADPSTSSPAPGTTSEPETQTPDPGTPTPDPGTSTSTQDPGTTVNPGTEICTSAGYHRDPHDCAVFYQCVPGKDGKLIQYRFICPSGLKFDDKSNICNWPQLVQC